MILIPTHLPSSLKKKNAFDNRHFFLLLKLQMGNFQKKCRIKETAY